MENLLRTIIVILALLDVALSYTMLHNMVVINSNRLNDDELKNSIQLIIRFVMMSAWVLNSMYWTNIAVVCFIMALLNSMLIYGNWKKIASLRKERNVINKISETIEKFEKDDD